MTYDYEERESDLGDSPVHTRLSHREIPRSLEEVGYAPRKSGWVCYDRTGYWRGAHEFDERSVGEPCLWCGKKRAACQGRNAA